MFQFRRFPSYTYLIQYTMTEVCSVGLLHSEIHGSKRTYRSPWLIAVNHVLLRLPMPRHSPCALYCFTICFMFLSSLRNDCFLILVVFYQIKFYLIVFTRSILICITFALFSFQVPFFLFLRTDFSNNSHCCSSLFSEVLVGTNGLEPSTSRLSGVRSNHLSYAPIFGGDEEDRTPDPLRARQVLSQLSYTPKYLLVVTTSSKLNNASNGSC